MHCDVIVTLYSVGRYLSETIGADWSENLVGLRNMIARIISPDTQGHVAGEPLWFVTLV